MGNMLDSKSDTKMRTRERQKLNGMGGCSCARSSLRLWERRMHVIDNTTD